MNKLRLGRGGYIFYKLYTHCLFLPTVTQVQKSGSNRAERQIKRFADADLDGVLRCFAVKKFSGLVDAAAEG